MRRLAIQIFAVIMCLILSSCTTKKKKGEIGWLGKSYQNVTARFNGYYNADVILKESMVVLDAQHQDNYNKILDIYPYASAENPQAVAPELDRAIEKVTTVAALHEPSHWVDDCYVLMGKAQYLKQDYESAEETFAYFAESFDSNDPQSRVYNRQDNKKSEKEKRKEKLKEERKLREADRKEKEKTKKAAQELKDQERETKEATTAKERKIKDKQKKADADFKAQERKLDKEQKNTERKQREADMKAKDDFEESQKKQRDKIKKQKLDTKKDFDQKEDKLQDEIRKLKSELSKEQSEARENERKWKQEERKKKSNRGEKRKKGTKKESEVKADFSSQIKLIEDRILGQIESKEIEIDALKNQETDKLALLDQAVLDLDKKEEEWEVIRAEEKQLRTKEKEATEMAQQVRKDQRAKDKEEQQKRKKKQKELEDKKKQEQEAEDIEALVKDDEIEEESADKKKKPNKVNTGGNGGFMKHKPIYGEGMLWLAKTYIERADFGTAEYLLNQLSETPDLRDKVAKEIPVALAHLNIKQRRYDLAIPALEHAIDVTKDKNSKARYAFIKAQIHEENNDPSAAYLAYDQASSYSRDYDMKINAQLSQIRNGWVNGNLSKSEADKKLNKLTKDSKNQEYLSQIYFTSAEINLANGDVVSAQEDFQKALDEGSANKAQKAESYYRLANLFYLSQDYISALNYYDSTLAIINVKDEKYFEVKKKSDNLKQISRQLASYNKQDSLLGLSTKSDQELKDLAIKILEEREEAKEELQAELTTQDEPLINNKSVFKAKHNSKFFAYNKLLLDKGKQDFLRKWGDRKLQNNWRRSTELEQIVNEENPTSDITDEADRQEDLTSGEINSILRDVPRTETQIASTNKKIENSLFELGSLYRTKIQNFKQSVLSLEELLTRYPKTSKKLDSYYLIYLDYLDMNQNGLANSYKQKILAEFTDSEYAKILSDPNYLKTRKSDREILEEHYSLTYASFDQAKYEQTIKLVDESLENFGKKNAYRVKYDLLKTMSRGNQIGKDVYIKELKDFTDRNRNTPEATRALEIMRFLKGDEEAFDSRLFEEDIEDFKIENDKLHYVLVVLYNLEQTEMNNAKIAISDYNEKYFKLDKLRLNNLFLNSENKAQIILIRKFSDKEKSMKYFDGIGKNQHDFLNPDELTFDVFAVTSRNYREIMKQKTITNYRLFFEKEYLE